MPVVTTFSGSDSGAQFPALPAKDAQINTLALDTPQLSCNRLPPSFACRMTSPRAAYHFYQDPCEQVGLIIVKLRGAHGNLTDEGFRIAQIPPGLVDQLAPKALEGVPQHLLDVSIAERILSARAQSPAAAPKITSSAPRKPRFCFYEDERVAASILKRDRSHFCEWALEGTTRAQSIVTRRELGVPTEREVTSKLGFEITHFSDGLSRMIFWPSGSERHPRPWTLNFRGSSQEDQLISLCPSYAAMIFGRFGREAVERFFSLSFPDQSKVMRNTPIDKLISRDCKLSIDDVCPANLSGRGMDFDDGSVLDNFEAHLDRRPKLLKSITLLRGPVVELYNERASSIRIYASADSAVPLVSIGKPTRTLPGLGYLDYFRVRGQLSALASNDEAVQRKSLTYLRMKGFHFDRCEGLQNPTLRALADHLPKGIERQSDQDALYRYEMAINALAGSEILRLSNPRAPWPELSLLKFTATADGYLLMQFELPERTGVSWFDANTAVMMDFLLPKFLDDEHDAKLRGFVFDAVEAFSRSPSEAVDLLLRCAEYLNYPELTFEGRNGPEVMWYGCSAKADIVAKIEATPALFHAVNSLIAVHALELKRKGVSSTRFCDAIHRPALDDFHPIQMEITHLNYRNFRLLFGENGLDGVVYSYNHSRRSHSEVQSRILLIDPAEDKMAQAQHVARWIFANGDKVPLIPNGLEPFASQLRLP